MTLSDFLAFYPQFTGFTPSIVPETFVAESNARFSDFLDDAEKARRLYVAHNLTLYARTVPASQSSESGEPTPLTPAALADAGSHHHSISSKKVGEVSVTYGSSDSSASSVSTPFADLKDTVYGLQLLSLIRLHAFPKYVP